MSSVMPGFAILSRRYFGTLLVNNSKSLQSIAKSDNTPNLIIVSAKHFSHISTERTRNNEKNILEPNSQR